MISSTGTGASKVLIVVGGTLSSVPTVPEHQPRSPRKLGRAGVAGDASHRSLGGSAGPCPRSTSSLEPLGDCLDRPTAFVPFYQTDDKMTELSKDQNRKPATEHSPTTLRSLSPSLVSRH